MSMEFSMRIYMSRSYYSLGGFRYHSITLRVILETIMSWSDCGKLFHSKGRRVQQQTRHGLRVRVWTVVVALQDVADFKYILALPLTASMFDMLQPADRRCLPLCVGVEMHQIAEICRTVPYTRYFDQKNTFCFFLYLL